MSTTSASSRPRKKGPTKDAWQAVRARFTQLYLQEEPHLTLREIKDILAQEDDFDAERHSYLLKIRQWNLYRNLKASEKEEIAREIDIHVAQGLQPPERMLHQRPVRHDKVARHLQRRRRSTIENRAVEETSPESSSTDHSTVDRTSNGDSQYSAILRVTYPRIEPQCQLENAETALHAVKECHRWYFCTQSRAGYIGRYAHIGRDANIARQVKNNLKHKPWCDWIVAGLDSLCRGVDIDMVRSFDLGCAGFMATLSHQSIDLIITIVRIFCLRDWQGHTNFKFCIQKHLFLMARLKLGLRNPLVHFLHCLQRENARLPKAGTTWRAA